MTVFSAQSLLLVLHCVIDPVLTASVVGLAFFVIENIKFKILDSPTYTSFENLVIDIGSSTSPFTIACVYRPPGSCSDEFLDQFLNLFEYLSSVSSSFLMCGDFNIHVDTSSSDSTKFLNCLDLANRFVTFFSDKINKIRDSFTNTDSFTLPAPSEVPKFDLFKSVSEDEVRKVITKSPTKSCLLDPWPTLLVKECLDILLPSVTKLVNCSLTEGWFQKGYCLSSD